MRTGVWLAVVSLAAFGGVSCYAGESGDELADGGSESDDDDDDDNDDDDDDDNGDDDDDDDNGDDDDDDNGDDDDDDNGDDDDDDNGDDDDDDDDAMPPAGPSPGCGTSPGSILEGSINAAGLNRTFIISLPPDYDQNTAYPVVFAWHGWGGNPQGTQDWYAVEQEWPGGDVIVFYPQGLEIGGADGWDLSGNGRDMALFDALANEAAQQLCVDLGRIFTTGFSFGSYMSNAVSCFRGSYIRAAAHAGGGGPPTNVTCQAPVASFLGHGVNDGTVAYGEGVAWRDKWEGLNGCSGPGDAFFPPGRGEAGVECYEYAGCADGDPLLWCSHQGDHDWYDWMRINQILFLAEF